MDSISYSLKKLMFSKREPSNSKNGRVGRRTERTEPTRSRSRRDSSPFEEVKIDQFDFDVKDVIDDKTSQRSSQMPSEHANRTFRSIPREFSGFEEIASADPTFREIRSPSQTSASKRESNRTEPVSFRGANREEYVVKRSDEFGGKFSSFANISLAGSESEGNLRLQQCENGDQKMMDSGRSTPMLSDILMDENELDSRFERPRAERHKPLTREQFIQCFDSDGRIVDEHEMKRAIFKGGVEEDIRKNVWQFLFELYPCNSTTREREILKTEQLIRYEALKERWKPLLQDIAKNHDSGIKFCPGWYGRKKQLPPSNEIVGRSERISSERSESADQKYGSNEIKSEVAGEIQLDSGSRQSRSDSMKNEKAEQNVQLHQQDESAFDSANQRNLIHDSENIDYKRKSILRQEDIYHKNPFIDTENDEDKVELPNVSKDDHNPFLDSSTESITGNTDKNPDLPIDCDPQNRFNRSINLVTNQDSVDQDNVIDSADHGNPFLDSLSDGELEAENSLQEANAIHRNGSSEYKKLNDVLKDAGRRTPEALADTSEFLSSKHSHDSMQEAIEEAMLEEPHIEYTSFSNCEALDMLDGCEASDDYDLEARDNGNPDDCSFCFVDNNGLSIVTKRDIKRTERTSLQTDIRLEYTEPCSFSVDENHLSCMNAESTAAKLQDDPSLSATEEYHNNDNDERSDSSAGVFSIDLQTNQCDNDPAPSSQLTSKDEDSDDVITKAQNVVDFTKNENFLAQNEDNDIGSSAADIGNDDALGSSAIEFKEYDYDSPEFQEYDKEEVGSEYSMTIDTEDLDTQLHSHVTSVNVSKNIEESLIESDSNLGSGCLQESQLSLETWRVDKENSLSSLQEECNISLEEDVLLSEFLSSTEIDLSLDNSGMNETVEKLLEIGSSSFLEKALVIRNDTQQAIRREDETEASDGEELPTESEVPYIDVSNVDTDKCRDFADGLYPISMHDNSSSTDVQITMKDGMQKGHEKEMQNAGYSTEQGDFADRKLLSLSEDHEMDVGFEERSLPGAEARQHGTEDVVPGMDRVEGTRYQQGLEEEISSLTRFGCTGPYKHKSGPGMNVASDLFSTENDEKKESDKNDLKIVLDTNNMESFDNELKGQNSDIEHLNRESMIDMSNEASVVQRDVTDGKDSLNPELATTSLAQSLRHGQCDAGAKLEQNDNADGCSGLRSDAADKKIYRIDSFDALLNRNYQPSFTDNRNQLPESGPKLFSRANTEGIPEWLKQQLQKSKPSKGNIFSDESNDLEGSSSNPIAVKTTMAMNEKESMLDKAGMTSSVKSTSNTNESTLSNYGNQESSRLRHNDKGASTDGACEGASMKDERPTAKEDLKLYLNDTAKPAGMPAWLAQQLNASSPAGTKISKTLHIHEEGMSLIEDTSQVLPLREITEKANMVIKQKLIEQRSPVAIRSSTPVETERSNGNYIRDEIVENIDGPFKALNSLDDPDRQVHRDGVEYSDQSRVHVSNQSNVFPCDVSQIASQTEAACENEVDPETGESKASPTSEEMDQVKVLRSKDDYDIEMKNESSINELRKAQSVMNLPNFSPLHDFRVKNSKSESNILDSTDSKLNTSNNMEHECTYCKNTYGSPVEFPAGFGEDLRRSVEIQAKVYAGRQPYIANAVCQALRTIDKDVPRTDRDLPSFRENDNPNLLRLRDALITYSFFHPDVGYAQGMNDIMSRFFLVMESESDAYWMFCNYMEHFKGDFMENDMLRKINLVEQLLMKMDRELYEFLQHLQMELIFCHRWLLLSFKREFSYQDGLRIFEIMSSRHLEVSSIEAEMERSRERARELEKDEGSRMEEIYIIPEYSFDIFLCVAMLHECRDLLMANDDMASVYQLMASLPQINDLDTILSKAEDLFFQYCRKSTSDCFQLIDAPIEGTQTWKQKLRLDF